MTKVSVGFMRQVVNRMMDDIGGSYQPDSAERPKKTVEMHRLPRAYQEIASACLGDVREFEVSALEAALRRTLGQVENADGGASGAGGRGDGFLDESERAGISSAPALSPLLTMIAQRTQATKGLGAALDAETQQGRTREAAQKWLGRLTGPLSEFGPDGAVPSGAEYDNLVDQLAQRMGADPDFAKWFESYAKWYGSSLPEGVRFYRGSELAPASFFLSELQRTGLESPADRTFVEAFFHFSRTSSGIDSLRESDFEKLSAERKRDPTVGAKIDEVAAFLVRSARNDTLDRPAELTFEKAIRELLPS